jgi:leucyl/phenylalanyl-tRNA--protein transferase
LESVGDGDLIAVGADLEPQTLVTAYASGVFPMPVRRNRLGWWSPDPRGVLPLDGLVVSRSLRRSLRRYSVTVDECFDRVIEACSSVPRPHGWINSQFVDAYTELHRRGLAHSIETWAPDGSLVGGLYGVTLGGLFAGESMFQVATDASKVALVGLVEILRPVPGALFDVQWRTQHLASLGVIDVPRRDYLHAVAIALDSPDPFSPSRDPW